MFACHDDVVGLEDWLAFKMADDSLEKMVRISSSTCRGNGGREVSSLGLEDDQGSTSHLV